MKMKKIIALAFTLVLLTGLCVFLSSAAEEIYDCGHTGTFEWVSTSQTCTAEGKRILKCTVEGCEGIKAIEIIPKHNYDIIKSTPATCSAKGKEIKFCVWCFTLVEEALPINKDNHIYGQWTVTAEASCSSQGVRERTCTLCSYVASESIPTNSSKHIAGSSWTIVSEPTCTAQGKRSNVCKECGLTFYEFIPCHSDATDGSLTQQQHAEKYKLISSAAANCTSPATFVYQCLKCTKKITVTSGEIDSDNHSYGDWTILSEASCNEYGVREKICKHNVAHRIKDDKYKPDSVHDYIEIEYTPGASCSENGTRKYQCKTCGYTKTEMTPPEHIFDSWILTGSCSTGGRAERTCLCGDDTQVTTFAAGEHLNYTVLSYVLPTCEYLGHQMIKCNDCGETIKYYPAEYAAFGHDVSDWIVITPTSCTASGLEQRICLTCDKVIEEKVVPIKNHDFIILSPAIEATCTEAGRTAYMYCFTCGAFVDHETVAALGHQWGEQEYDGYESYRQCKRCYLYQSLEGVECDCLCHNSHGLAKTVFKMINFFNKLFKKDQFCACGVQHYGDTTIFEDLFAPILGLFDK